MDQPTQTTLDETQSLQRCMRELASLSRLSAVWSRNDRREIANGLAAFLSRSLSLSLVYVRVSGLNDADIVEVVQTPHGLFSESQTQEIFNPLRSLLKNFASDGTATIPDPFGNGELRLAVIPVGCEESGGGVLVAGSQQPDFPGQTDQLLLVVAANQADVVLQKKRAEEQLHRTEQDLSDFIDNSVLGLHWLGPDGTILRANRAELNLLGYSPSEYLGHHISDFHADKDVIESILRRLRGGEDLCDCRARMLCKDGSVKHVLINCSGLWEDDRLIHTRCSTREITTQTQALEALRTSENRYRRLIALLPVAAYTCEAPSGVITFYNQHATILWGRAPNICDTDERFCGSFRVWKPDGTFVPHDETPMAIALREGRQFRNVEAVIERPDGTRITALVNINPIFDDDGRLVGAINAFHDTTALKRAETALRENERRFREMIDALPAAIYTTDAEGRLTHYNPAAAELSGRTPELDKDQWSVLWKLYNPDGTPLPHSQCPMAVALNEGRAVRGAEAILERPDGTRRWFTPYPTPLQDEKGHVVGGINMLVDVTERKAVEERLAADLAATRRLQLVSTELLHEDELDAIYQKVLDAAVEIMGSDFASMQMLIPDRCQGRGELMLLAHRGFPPLSAETWKTVQSDTPCICGEALRTGQRVIVPDIETCQFVDGTSQMEAYRDAGIRAAQSTPLRSRTGRILGMISTHWRKPHQPSERALGLLDVLARQAADLIERRQTDEASRKQTERLQLLLEAAAVLLTADNPDAMLRGLLTRIGPNLNIDVYFNYMVHDSGDALWLASCDGIPIETARTISRLEFGQSICGTVAQQRQPIVASYIHLSDDPKARLVKSLGIRAYACNPLMSENRLLGTLSFASRTKDEFDADEVAFLQTICHYVTVAYERLRLVNQLKEADRRKDEFLATLAHELRNPLAPVRNAVQVLRMKGPDEPDLRWGRDVIERQVDHLTRLIDDLLDVSRITRNKLELRKQRVALTEVISGAVESSRPLVEECGQTLTVTLPSEPVHINGDLVRLSQVFLNLLNNAAKYTERGGQIRLTAERQGGDVVVKVKDSGVGIPAEKLPRLFEMFFQVDRSLEKSQGGLGIGLSLARRLVELHGGKVEARSEGIGKGSEFIVCLPVLVDNVMPLSSREPTDNDCAQATPTRRILVVDDNRDSADSLAMLLRLMGNEVLTAYDGLAALEVAERIRPDVVLLDIGMPRLNGYDTCHRIREQPWGRSPVMIALTGWGQEEDKRRTQDAGFDAHLIKPVDPTALMNLLDSRAKSRSAS
jgi:PAS domain S-box-containing protein